MVRPYFTITSISQQSMTNGGFSVESLCLIFILCRVHISKCLHFCRSETVWIPIEFGPPAEQLAWRCIRQTVPWDLLVSLCPALSHSSPQSWSMSCSITQLAGASTTGHLPFPHHFVKKSVQRHLCQLANALFLLNSAMSHPRISYSLICIFGRYFNQIFLLS